MKLTDIYWIAALLEGEGTFRYGHTSPQIQLKMTDLDIIERYRKITKTSHQKLTIRNQEGRKIAYVTYISAKLAIQWLMTIYPIMGMRRQEKIREIISKWKNEKFVIEQNKIHAKKYCSTDINKYNAMIRTLMFTKNISRREAKKMAEKMLENSTTVQ